MNKDCQAALQGRKGLDKYFTLMQQACKFELWPLFKEAKVAGKRVFWHLAEFFINDTQICSPSSI
jgi:hypothetical protein